MPNYRYRSRDPECGVCEEGFEVYQPFEEAPLVSCVFCGSHIYRVIGKNIGIKIKRSLQGMDGSGLDYREDLAARPGDPEAWVDGPRALQKLIDKRKAQGWHIEKTLPTMTTPTEKDPRKVVEEAYTRAKAKGFVPDNSEA